MYGEKNKEKDYNDPVIVRQPELIVIIESLQNIADRYDVIVCETKSKLQAIKRYEEPSRLNDGVEKQPESATEEINRLLSRLNDLNEKAEANLRHLREIV